VIWGAQYECVWEKRAVRFGLRDKSDQVGRGTVMIVYKSAYGHYKSARKFEKFGEFHFLQCFRNSWKTQKFDYFLSRIIIIMEKLVLSRHIARIFFKGALTDTLLGATRVSEKY